MQQLKMMLLPEIRVPALTLPEGFSISVYQKESDQEDWFQCCLNGKLVDETNTAEAAFKKDILDRNIDPRQDVFFLDHEGKHIATSTCYLTEDGTADLHMVGMRTEYRGKGLSRYIVYAASAHMNGKNVKNIHLTTDEFRRGAICAYLNAGYLPVNYDTDMQERWEQVLSDLGIACSVMLTDDGKFDKIIYGVNKG